MKGKTQFPQPVVVGAGDGAGDGRGDGTGDGTGDGDGADESPQVADSSPTACMASLFCSKTAALLETPSTPRAVPVGPYVKSGLE